MYYSKWLAVLILCFLGLASTLMASSVEEARSDAVQGEVKSAIIKLKNVLQKDPENVEARLLLGNIYLNGGDTASAEKELRRALRLGAPLGEVAEPLLDSYLSQNKLDEIRAFINANPAGDSALKATYDAFSGFVALSRGQNREASQLFGKALEKDPLNLRATLGLASFHVAENKLDQALLVLGNYLDSDRQSIRVSLLRAEVYRKLGNLQAAENDYQAVLARHPGQVQAVLGMAFVHAARKQADDVLRLTGELPRQVQEIPLVDYLKALAWYIKQDFDQSEQFLRKVLGKIPDHMQSHLLTGVIQFSRENWQQAEDHLARVHKITPDNASVTKLLATTYLRLGQAENTEKLMKRFVLTGGRDDAQAHTLLGSAYLQMGDTVRSQEHFARAAELAPEQQDMKTRLAFGLLAGGNTEEAIATLESSSGSETDSLQADVLLVFSHIRAGNTDKALAVARRMQTDYADTAVPHNLEGLALMSAGRHDDAEQAFLHALEIDPGFEVAGLNRARNALAAGDQQRARELFEESLAQNPRNMTALLALAQLAQRNGDEQTRMQYLQQAVDIDPGNPVSVSQLADIYVRQGEPLKALERVARARQDNAQAPSLIRAQGMAELAAGQVSSAINTFEQLLNQLPDSVEASFQLGRAYLVNDELDRAGDYFERAANGDPDKKFPIVWLAKSDVALKQNRFNDVVEITAQLLDAGHELAAVYAARSHAFQGLGKITEAISLARKAYTLEPAQTHMMRLASLYQRNDARTKAIDLLSDWTRSQPDDVAALTMLAMIQQQSGQAAQAVDSYEKALASQPQNAVVMNNLAWLYHQQGDNRALDLARQAYELAQRRPEIVDTYGWILFETGQAQQALPILQEALLQSPNHPEIGLHVAKALRHLGREKEAEPILKRIVRNAPDSAFASEARQILAQ